MKDYAEVLQVKDAHVLASYTEDFYQGTAAVTCKEFPADGKCGRAYYAAARSSADQMRSLFLKMLQDAGISVRELPSSVDCSTRIGEEGIYDFYMNYGTTPAKVSGVTGTDLITGSPVQGELELEAYGVAVIKH